MSETTPTPDVPTPSAPTTTAQTTPGMLDGFWTCITHGAALIYHRVITAEQDLSAWVTSNPALMPLLKEAVNFAETVLTAHSIPVTGLISAEQAVMAVLSKMAQSDTTVVSGAKNPTP